MSNLIVSETILKQLGGRKFIAMTGAHSFIGGNNMLTFKLPRKSGYVKSGIWAVKITLTPADEYNMEFFAGSYKTAIKTVAKHEGVYFDQLQELFTQETGLYTSL